VLISLPPIYVRQVVLVCLYLRALLDSDLLRDADLLVEDLNFSLAHSVVGDAAQLFKALLTRQSATAAAAAAAAVAAAEEATRSAGGSAK
jgi:hypothetical protein